jgi:hypothetical protein
MSFIILHVPLKVFVLAKSIEKNSTQLANRPAPDAVLTLVLEVPADHVVPAFL